MVTSLKKKTKDVVNLFAEFSRNEKASGTMLIICTVASIAITNSRFGSNYLEFWHTQVLSHSLQHWVNDGLMAIFFLLIGLEIERELYIGELSDPKSASLPIVAAIGGMVIPALLHFLFNHGTATVDGAGIPMATDIAFALGILALLGSRIPISLKVFLTALAIIDDLGAIAVIALFYVSDFSLLHFASALGIFSLLLVLNRLKVKWLSIYLALGAVMWYFMLMSGVHATIAGVLLAFAIPFRNLGDDSPSYRLQHFLHKPVAFVIMPLFALANTGIALGGNWLEGLATANSLGILAGLLVGKPLGIVLFSFVAVRQGWSRLPAEVCWRQMVGTGFLGGIGFTMSIFITLLAFGNPEIIDISKLSILLASLLAGTIGYLILRKQDTPKGSR
ncbi:sodium:proton antiporter [Geoanaerobacter pelophilus]|uniref:Na(+)/H(+) antiporter NhaA n=1 Tax=Geoanaerobacter pelophilus TaxID=60036 RepID=A0ABQ0ME84_9BACT|nr:Na+/H+ antiporter NhaA [Geoanaerobacter pelophilus]GAW65418.1 sodium:proton antiporter [Geoanaerobacter pelophilus]